MNPIRMKQLVVLVADKDMEAVVRGLLTRSKALGVRAVEFEVYAHPGHDSGCRSQGVTFLRTFCKQYEHCLLMFDREGSGREDLDATELETRLEGELQANGWQDRGAVVVLDPELEIWVWSDSPEVDRSLGWSGRLPSVRDWLVEEQFLKQRDLKPERPKEAFRHALQHVRKPPSPAIFSELARSVSVNRCTDRAFQKFTHTLSSWFPQS